MIVALGAKVHVVIDGEIVTGMVVRVLGSLFDVRVGATTLHGLTQAETPTAGSWSWIPRPA